MRHLSILVVALLFTACSESPADPSETADDLNEVDTFTLSSSAIVDGELVDEFQCEENTDGVENSIPLAWEGVPDGTQSLAISMHHYPDEDDTTSVSSYLQLWGIDPETSEIAYGAANDGPWYMGSNKDGNAISYTSPCSAGTGSHSYTITLYALTSDPVAQGLLPAQDSLEVDYTALRTAVDAAGINATAELTFNSTTGDSTTGETTTDLSSSGCEIYDEAFASVDDLVSHECDETYLSITSETGLPSTRSVADEEKIMVGITSWIQRVAIPYTYKWNVPLDPAWTDATTEASARGPIAVAVDGVPIFHYERRPDVSTSLGAYTEENDTVVAGELDQCGGHSGQGEDYHYHYAPVCLLDDHDLTQPVAFGLDGTPVYFGEGGSDYYGNGQFNDWNNFPAGMTASELDECNAVQLSDGSFVHYTTKTPPYLIGCHHAEFDSALQIEPAPMAGREQGLETPTGGEFGEPVTTVITDFTHNDDDQYTLKYQAPDGSDRVSAVIYRQVSTTDSETCWEFEFRADENTPGEGQTACRENTASRSLDGVKSFEHAHTH